MKKMMTFLTIALTTLVAFVSCANPTYSDEMIDVKPVDIVFDMDESDGSWTVKKGWGDNAEVSVDTDKGVLTIKAIAESTQDVVKFDNPGATKVVVEYSSTGKTTFGFLSKTAMPWDNPRINDQYFDPVEEGKIELDIPDGAGMLAICSNGDPTNVITVTKITVK